MLNVRFDSRAGRLVRQPGGYSAFEPRPLPPDPPLRLDGELAVLISQAERSLGRLDGVAASLAEPDVLVAMSVRQEAVMSCRIEGTAASLADLLELEAGHPPLARDVEDVARCVAAMAGGLERLGSQPVTLAFLKDIHATLMEGQGGAKARPGELRATQNWIGTRGGTLADAQFVPPPPGDVRTHVTALEKFLQDDELPLLLQVGLAHAQFETIHPFAEGNGRLGRLLITFLLSSRGALAHPLLCLSAYLEQHRSAYYERLQSVRTEGAWEAWLAFFLRGVREVADHAAATARAVAEMREQHRRLLGAQGPLAPDLLRLHAFLLRHPCTDVDALASTQQITIPAANKLVDKLETLGLLEEITGRKRGRLVRFAPLATLFERPLPARS
jgi:Fic family protein